MVCPSYMSSLVDRQRKSVAASDLALSLWLWLMLIEVCEAKGAARFSGRAGGLTGLRVRGQDQ